MNELQIVEKLDSKSEPVFLLIETSGTICGIYKTKADALKSKPSIEKNLKAFKENGTLVKVRPKKHRRQKSRRKSKPSRKQA